MKAHLVTRLATAMLIAAPIAGCNSPAPQSNLSVPGVTAPIKVTLSYRPSGTAALNWDPQSGNITAKLQMAGLAPGGTYAIDIHQGACAAPGDVAVPFPKVNADGAGAISSSIKATTLPMAPVGPRVGGSANLTYEPKNKTLVVATSATGLAPGSVHAEQIGLGTCEAQGPLKYHLNDLVASASATAYQTTIVEDVDQPPPSSGWYLNVYLGPSAHAPQNGHPTPDAQPIVCGKIGGQ